ncbi:MAG TPA: ADP compounds hydrolase NudE [Candidatus Wildermuthbacteria bacterium]|uniref:NUDIX hydrolase n=1 Tax=Candidatus Yanofskybacteria bacterium GW2011_GWC1_48_11 TaxID=1619027 RepID=A0A837IL89_9BACT|nr:MAG: NUDIX hydrolase [Candidatus Yanofskybacteria bacterium GW2011_GWC1_48_11]KKW04131.1 MAG: NUDIX hydrolase [Parcubacteria group bacterium GW2011_GWB1_49_12]KKW08406.1 MAG: NUDIX hydrolase [Parcubacteria group bacterium GW2011_GWA1_49_26]KKW14335.1 MAG: NUDIX hydrolase [Parcubacteria group bacterium GW2011_GWA2_50_10]OHA61179.1 MAG: hypothetical protein A2109_01555 [Candidatus Wildermuthbacteria bacterium GWA1_49_26]OHA65524.1 MAG: hypothetical protein A2674_02800 [Candidatus Wildermuthba
MPKRLGEKEIFKSRIFTIKEAELEFASGRKVKHEFLDLGDSVMVVPIAEDGTLLLINEYHTAINEFQLGLCKGALHKGEDPRERANTELQEEVGHKAQKLDELIVLNAFPGYQTNKTFVYLARDLVKSKLAGDVDEEELEVFPYPFLDFEKLIEDGRLKEARAIAALYLAKKFLNNS